MNTEQWCSPLPFVHSLSLSLLNSLSFILGIRLFVCLYMCAFHRLNVVLSSGVSPHLDFSASGCLQCMAITTKYHRWTQIQIINCLPCFLFSNIDTQCQSLPTRIYGRSIVHRTRKMRINLNLCFSSMVGFLSMSVHSLNPMLIHGNGMQCTCPEMGHCIASHRSASNYIAERIALHWYWTTVSHSLLLGLLMRARKRDKIVSGWKSARV